MTLISSGTTLAIAMAIALLTLAATLLFFFRRRARQAVTSAHAEARERISQRVAATARLALILGDGETVPGVSWSEYQGDPALPWKTGSPTTRPIWISDKV